MLVDPKFARHDPILAIVAAMNGGGVSPERLGLGLYLAGHWNVGDITDKIRDRWKEEDWEHEFPFPEYGVADTPQQILEKFPEIESCPEPVFVSCVKIVRADQPIEGGWRWHKWGRYIGDHEPKCEYLAHEDPSIAEVYTFHVHELQPDFAESSS